MPRFAPTIKSLLMNKEKLLELAKIPLNENCSAMLLKKLPEKLGDPDKFLIPCNFPGMDVFTALADLGASINLMPLSIWKKLSLPELTPTRMTLELADRSITYPKGLAEDVFVKVATLTGRALIDVYGEEITLRVDNEAVTFNLDQTTRYSSTNDKSVNRIDIIDAVCEEYAPEFLGFSNSSGGNPTPTSEPFTSEFILEEIEAYLKDDSISPKIDHADCNPEEDICLIEKLLNNDPFQLPPMDLKQSEVTKTKSSIEEPPELELKDLPSHLEYAFLEENDKLPVIIAKGLKNDDKDALLKVLKSHKRAIARKITDIKGLTQNFFEDSRVRCLSRSTRAFQPLLAFSFGEIRYPKDYYRLTFMIGVRIRQKSQENRQKRANTDTRTEEFARAGSQRGKTGGFDQITDKDAIILYSQINIDYPSIFWEDIIIKLNKRHREKVVPYTRFLSLLMMHKMKEGYGDGEVTPYPTQVVSVNNWVLKPNQPEEPLFTNHMLAICNAAEPVVFKAPKPSSNAERVPQGIKPGAKPGHKKHLASSKQPSVSSKDATKGTKPGAKPGHKKHLTSSKQPSKDATKGGSSKAPTGSKTGHLKRKKESSSAMDSNPSQTSASTLVVAEMHKEDQQATGSPTSLGVTSEARVNPQLSSCMSVFNLNEPIYLASFIIHSESTLGDDASAVSTAEADPGKSAPIIPADNVPAGRSSSIPADYVSAGHVLVPADKPLPTIPTQSPFTYPIPNSSASPSFTQDDTFMPNPSASPSFTQDDTFMPEPIQPMPTFTQPAVHTQTNPTGQQYPNNVQSQQFQQFQTATISANNAKFPYLEKEKYEIWAMKMEYWIQNADHNLWRIVQQGNSPKRLGKDAKGNTIVHPPVSLDEHVAVQRENKVRTLLLQALPEDHMPDFHHYDDARDIWMAVKARFGGNEESKKMKKTMLKQQFAEFSVTEEEGLHKGYDRFQKILSQLNQLAYCSISFQTSGVSDNVMECVLHSFVAENEQDQDMIYEDFDQVDQLEMEEMDLKWQMAMLSLRINRFEKKAGRKMNYNNQQPARFDRRKVRCYKCLQLGHFARECNVKTVDDKARYSAFKVTEVKTDEPKALVSVDSMVNWSDHAAENTTGAVEKVYGMMAGFHADSADASDAAAEFAMMGISPKTQLRRRLTFYSTFVMAGEMLLLFLPSYNWKTYCPGPASMTLRGNKLTNCQLKRTSQSILLIGPPIPVGGLKRPATVSAGRPVSAGWLNPAARPFFRPSSVYNTNWSNIYDPMIKGRWGTAVKTSAGSSQNWLGSLKCTNGFVIKGGIVKFGGGTIGRISGKGTIRTSKLDFENVYYVEELQHFNLFSVSQICDKKNKVLFTDTDCLVLSEEFQLPDASQVVLRIPRKHDLYTFHISDLQPEQKGHRQEEGIDYDEVFAPVARIEAIRLFLAFASYMGFLVYQLDVKSAFLYGEIEEEVYVTQPKGFEVPYFQSMLYRVDEVYIDKTLFIKKDSRDIILVQVYVDDIIFGSTNKAWCDEFEVLMKGEFEMSAMGEMTFFLGLQVKQLPDGLFISQDKYVKDMLTKFDMESVRTATTPYEATKT
ncbi:reverse transcriptase domain-containing protein [Tanacetum coccineum]